MGGVWKGVNCKENKWGESDGVTDGRTWCRAAVEL